MYFGGGDIANVVISFVDCLKQSIGHISTNMRFILFLPGSTMASHSIKLPFPSLQSPTIAQNLKHTSMFIVYSLSATLRDVYRIRST